MIGQPGRGGDGAADSRDPHAQVEEGVLDHLPDGVVIADERGQVLTVNSAAAKMLGLSASDCPGRPLGEVVALQDLEGRDWVTCVDPYGGFELRTQITERPWYRPDGRELLVTARLVREGPVGPVRRVVVCLREVRARDRTDRERSDLVATVAHELRAPLTGVKGFTATLLAKWERFTDSQRLLMLRTVDADADRLTRLIAELLDVARIDAGRLTLRRQPLDLAATVAAVLDTAAAGAGRNISLHVPGPLPQVWADPDKVAQVVTNLVENAVRHGNGEVEVALRRQDDVTGGKGVEMLVDDNGSGIPRDIRSRVFTRFWKHGQRGGSGLGLYIVRGLVEAHLGEVSVLDAPGGGARIRVWLPQAPPEALVGDEELDEASRADDERSVDGPDRVGLRPADAVTGEPAVRRLS